MNLSGNTGYSSNAPEENTPVPPDLREILSSDILQGTQRVAIIHNGQRYFLSVTRNGKLILQK